MGKGKEIIKKVKYISIDVYQTMKYDMFKNWKDLDKPKEIMNLLMIVFIIQIYLNRFTYIGLTILLYMAAYVWKIERRGEWKHLMRNDYKKKI